MNSFVRSDAVDLSRYLPAYLSKDGAYNKLLKALSKSRDGVRKKIQLLLEQMFVDTAADCLDEWESFLGIKVDRSKLTTERRAQIIAKIQGTQPVTVAFLTAVVNQYMADQLASIEEHNDEYRMEVLYHGGQVIDYATLRKAIRTYLPAHIGYKLITLTTGLISESTGGTVQCYNSSHVDSSLGYAISIDDTTQYHGGAVIHVYKTVKISGGQLNNG